MGLTRRDFLRQTGLALTALGVSQVGLSVACDRYRRVLADPTPRKLALLVGINQYREGSLNGCLNDIELQRELLIHRFGVHPEDIVSLVDQQATREAIETTFVSHLIQQAKPEDVVIFHFSGYGSTVNVGNSADALRTGLVTIDAPVPDGDKLIVQDLLEDTLLLLLRSLPTNKVTTILDASYTYPGVPLQGNLRIRTRPTLTAVQASEAELAFQEQLLSQSGFDREQLDVQRRSSQIPGVMLAATRVGKLATEARWNGFSAGLFTYALTQHLWHTTPATTLRVVMGGVSEQVGQLVNQEQQPQLSGQKIQEQTLLPYYLAPVPLTEGDGVITALEDGGKTARLWLAGLPAYLLEQYGSNSLLTLTTADSTPLQLQLLARDGLTAKVKVVSSDPEATDSPALQLGQFVREQLRVLPRNIGLTIALDSNLERIERVDAVSALSQVPHVSSAIAGEQSADYLFSKIQDAIPTQVATLPTASMQGLVNNSSAQGGYGLFSPGRDVILYTAGERGEAVKVAVRRLAPKLQALLAAKLLSLTANESSSGLAVTASLLLGAEKQVLLQRATSVAEPVISSKQEATLSSEKTLRSRRLLAKRPQQSAGQDALPANDQVGILTVPAGSSIQFQLENLSAQPLYILLLGRNSNGELVALYSPTVRDNSAAIVPPETSDQLSASLAETIAPGETLTLPRSSNSFQWIVRGSAGLVETYILCSRAPFTQSFNLLIAALKPQNDTPVLGTLSNPLEVAHAILQDLHQASAPLNQLAGSDSFALDMNAWTTLRFVYQVV